MPPAYGSPAWVERMKTQKDNRAADRHQKFLCKAAVKAAVRAAKREEKKRCSANLQAMEINLRGVKAELAAKARRANVYFNENNSLQKRLRKQQGETKAWEETAEKHHHDVRALKKKVRELEVAKAWEETAEKHLRDLRTEKKKVKQLEVEKAWLERQLVKYKAFCTFVDQWWWWWVKCGSDPSTLCKLTRLWRTGPKSPADGGRGGGQ